MGEGRTTDRGTGERPTPAPPRTVETPRDVQDLLGNAEVAARWAALDDHQRGFTDGDDERGILELLAGADLPERAALLRRFDQNRDHHDLDELVFHDVDDREIRASLLALVAETASVPKEVGVISDFDDTVAPQKDRRFGDTFPGTRELFAALEGDVPGDVHYVTGRPPIAAGGVKREIAERGLPAGTLEEGDLGRVLFGGLDGIRDEKLEDIERLLELHPGQAFVMLGDDAQRDPQVYAEILKRHPDLPHRAFIRRTGTSTRPEDPTLRYVDDWFEALGTLGPEPSRAPPPPTRDASGS